MTTSKPLFNLDKASWAGILLMLAAALALIVANSSLNHYYQTFLSTPVSIKIGELVVNKPVTLWINDGLMSAFFLMVGLELKYEFMEGVFADRKQIVLPAIAAVGGMLVPALVYAAFNYRDPYTLHGWAIPAATDIAFALGILALVGNKIPKNLKVLLTSIAIFDDVGAILIIALFYTAHISMIGLGLALVCVAILCVFKFFNVTRLAPYLFIGLIMWAALLKSGVHATIAGVVLAFFIPLSCDYKPHHSPLKYLERELHFEVSYFILPLFAFVNSGISFKGLGLQAFTHPVALGVACGLFIGKQIGIFGGAWLAIKSGLAKLPDKVNWGGLYGIAILSGIGFTMSLFIGALAFHGSNQAIVFDERVGILSGSLLSAIVGFYVLRKVYRR